MDEIQKAAKAFEKLLNTNTSYRIIGAKKGKLHSVDLFFQKSNFVHIAGLHHLKDIPNITRAKRENVFDDILNGIITDDLISKSNKYHKIQERISALSDIESLLDSNRVIFKFFSKFSFGSMIDADYLLCSKSNAKDIYIFLDKNQNEDKYFCRSFFPKECHDYTARQSQLTMLYKEKTVMGVTHIQLDKLYTYQTVEKSEYEHLKQIGVHFELLSSENDKYCIRYYTAERRKLLNNENTGEEHL
ncbi:MAG: hypothetical protein II059_02870 [Clostridia bacterium]|nr:hypothetical protein [Clostridia bacterium]